MAIKERIEKLEMMIFALSMKDRWTEEDYEKNREWKEELKGLKENV